VSVSSSPPLSNPLTCRDPDHSQYSTAHSPWARTRRLQAAQTVALPDSAASRQATTMAATAPDQLGLAELTVGDAPAPAPANEPETLFGPHIGAVPPGPAWTEPAPAQPGAKQQDELTLDVLKGWIAKSKDVRARPALAMS
jgi:hypothetical protein